MALSRATRWPSLNETLDTDEGWLPAVRRGLSRNHEEGNIPRRTNRKTTGYFETSTNELHPRIDGRRTREFAAGTRARTRERKQVSATNRIFPRENANALFLFFSIIEESILLLRRKVAPAGFSSPRVHVPSLTGLLVISFSVARICVVIAYFHPLSSQFL